jgi:hypothetical protein
MSARAILAIGALVATLAFAGERASRPEAACPVFLTGAGQLLGARTGVP